MKKLLTLFIGLFSIINFGYCSTVPNGLSNLSSNQLDWLNTNAINHGTNANGSVINLYDWGNETNGVDRNLCVILSGFSRTSDFQWRLTTVSSLTTVSNGPFYSVNDISLLCSSGRRRYFVMASTSSSNKFTIGEFRVVSPNQLLYLINSQYDFYECNDYLSSCQYDLNSCLNSSCENDLLQCQEDLINCGEGNTPSCESGDIQRSSLFINDIQHESASNINITIPEEIERDYTNEEDEFDLTVNGYNVDNEYISQIIENEKITPTADDFSYLIENLGSYIPLLCIAGLMITARYIIKKVF